MGQILLFHRDRASAGFSDLGFRLQEKRGRETDSLFPESRIGHQRRAFFQCAGDRIRAALCGLCRIADSVVLPRRGMMGGSGAECEAAGGVSGVRAEIVACADREGEGRFRQKHGGTGQFREIGPDTVRHVVGYDQRRDAVAVAALSRTAGRQKNRRSRIVLSPDHHACARQNPLCTAS